MAAFDVTQEQIDTMDKLIPLGYKLSRFFAHDGVIQLKRQTDRQDWITLHLRTDGTTSYPATPDTLIAAADLHDAGIVYHNNVSD